MMTLYIFTDFLLKQIEHILYSTELFPSVYL